MALSVEDVLPRRRFTVEDVYEMVRAGILGEDEHVELIDGELIPMSPQGQSHALLAGVLARRLERAFGGRAFVLAHSPLRAGRHHLPEPDLVVYRGAIDFGRPPEAEEPLLVVEIAQTSRARDQAKAAVYAQCGVPVYWLIDLPRRAVMVCERPSAEGYRSIRLLSEAEALSLPDCDETWSVAEVLPPPGTPVEE